MKITLAAICIILSSMQKSFSMNISDCMQYITNRDNDKALDCLNRESRKNPNSFNVYFLRGVVHSGSNDSINAISDFSKAIELNPKNSEAWVMRANVYIHLGKDLDAIRDLSAAISFDTGENKIFRASLISQRAGVYQHAKLYEKALQDYKNSMNIFDKVDSKTWTEKNVSKEIQNGLYVDIYMGMCTCNLLLTNFADAAQFCQKVTTIDNASILPRVNLASAYIETNQHQKAIDVIESANPDLLKSNFMANYNLSIANYHLYKKTGDIKYQEKFKTHLATTESLTRTPQERQSINQLKKFID